MALCAPRPMNALTVYLVDAPVNHDSGVIDNDIKLKFLHYRASEIFSRDSPHA